MCDVFCFKVSLRWLGLLAGDNLELLLLLHFPSARITGTHHQLQLHNVFLILFFVVLLGGSFIVVQAGAYDSPRSSSH